MPTPRRSACPLLLLLVLFFLGACSVAKPPPAPEPRTFAPREVGTSGMRCSLTTRWEDDRLHYLFVIDRGAAVTGDQLLLRPVVTIRMTGRNHLDLLSVTLKEFNPLNAPEAGGERIGQSGTVVCPLETYKSIETWDVEVQPGE